jgi:monoamine oxidase
MARSAAFQTLARTMRIARFCDRHGLSTREGLERAAALEAVDRGASRREFLTEAAKLAALGGIGAVAGPLGRAHATPRPPSGDVAIIGAGLAGLACGDELQRYGVLATIYEASDRAGGRCFSLGGAFPGPVEFPGQVVERGGEFIDTWHKTMIGYAQRFGLALEDVTKRHEDVFYYFFGQHHAESEVVDELRQLVDAMRDDLRTVGSPTADSFTPADAVLDLTNVRE